MSNRPETNRSPVNRDEIMELSLAVFHRAQVDEDFYLSYNIAGQPSGEISSITTIYTVDNEDTPPLRKSYLPRPDNIAGALTAREKCLNEIEAQAPWYPDNLMLRVAESMIRAKQSFIEGITSNQNLPKNTIHLLGMFVVYDYQAITLLKDDNQQYLASEKNSSACFVASRQFLDTLIAESPHLQVIEDLEDHLEEDEEKIAEMQQNMYATEAEHDSTLPGYEEWARRQKRIMEAILSIPDREHMQRLMAMATLRLFLLPKKRTHPVLQRRIFE